MASADHWITRSARMRMVWGIVSPKALAVLRLAVSASLVGCSTERFDRLGWSWILFRCVAGASHERCDGSREAVYIEGRAKEVDVPLIGECRCRAARCELSPRRS